MNTKMGFKQIDLATSSYEKNIVKYYIEIQTGRDNGAGTDASVTLNIFGSEGKIMETTLTAYDVITCNKVMFETAGLDIFEIFKPKNIGKVYALNLTCRLTSLNLTCQLRKSWTI
jgi:hypothetical protein